MKKCLSHFLMIFLVIKAILIVNASAAEWLIIDQPVNGLCIDVPFIGASFSVYNLETGETVTLDFTPMDISNGIIVGVKNGNIMVYDYTSRSSFEIDSDVIYKSPAIHGNTIVYVGNSDIYSYDLETDVETRITNTASIESYPDVFGDNIVYRREDAYVSICLFNNTHGETIIATYQPYGYPSIYGDKVIWISYFDEVSTCWMYNISSGDISEVFNIGRSWLWELPIYGDLIGCSASPHGWTNYAFLVNITSGIRTNFIIGEGSEWIEVRPNSISDNMFIWWDGSGHHLAIRDIDFVTQPSFSTDKPVYYLGEQVMLEGGFYCNIDVQAELNITLQSTGSRIFSGIISGQKGEYINFSTLDNGSPINWIADTTGAEYVFEVALDFTSPYYLSIDGYTNWFDVGVPLQSVIIDTDKKIYNITDTVHINGDITAAGDVSDVSVKIDVIDAADESVIQNLVLNQIVQFQEGIPQTLKEINFGQDVKWNPIGRGEYQIRLNVSEGDPGIENRLVYSGVFKVARLYGYSGEKPLVVVQSKGATSPDIQLSSIKQDFTQFEWRVILDELDEYCLWNASMVILSINDPTQSYSSSELDAISNWFDLGRKTIWVTSDDDYDDNRFRQQSANTLLEAIDSKLRVESSTLTDTGSNAGASYRILGTSDNCDPDYIELVDGVNLALFHGTSDIIIYMDGAYHEIEDLETAHTIITTSNQGLIVDNTSPAPEVHPDEEIGVFILLALEEAGNDNLVILGGESPFNHDYGMYKPELIDYQRYAVDYPQQGATLFVNILNYALEAPNADPSVVYLRAWGYPGGRLDPGGLIERGSKVRVFSQVSDAETASSALTVYLSYRPAGGGWVREPASYYAPSNYWYIDWTIPMIAVTGLYDTRVEVSDPDGGSAERIEAGEFTVIAPNTNPSVVYLRVWGYPGGRLDPLGVIDPGSKVRIFSQVKDLETASSTLTVYLSCRHEEGEWVRKLASYYAPSNYWYIDWVIPMSVEPGVYDTRVEVSDPDGGSAERIEAGEFTVSSPLNADPSIVYLRVWGYPGGRLDPLGVIDPGAKVRIFSQVKDPETASPDLTVYLSYHHEDGEWVRQLASYYAPSNYWYVDWTIPLGAEAGVYDTRMEVSDGDGGSAERVETGEFTVSSPPNSNPAIVYLRAWGYPGGRLDLTSGEIARGSKVRVFSQVKDLETASPDLTVYLSYRTGGGEWVRMPASYYAASNYWYIDWTIPMGAVPGLYDTRVEVSDGDGGSVERIEAGEFTVY